MSRESLAQRLRTDSKIANKPKMTPPLYQGDCLTVMQQLEDNTIDLIYLDRPFLTQPHRAGLFIRAIREDEEAAAALGVNIVRYKILVFVITSTLAAGAVQAFRRTSALSWGSLTSRSSRASFVGCR